MLAPQVPPSVVVEQAEQPAVRELNETRILDMAQLTGAPPPAVEASDAAEQTGIGRVIARIKGKPRMVAYAVLGVLLVALQIGMRWHQQSVAESAERARAAAVAKRAVAASSTVLTSVGAKPAVRAVDQVAQIEPLPPGVEPDVNRAAALYASGDYGNAYQQYRALAAATDPDPVFAVIAHSLEQRLRHPPVKR